MRELAYSEMSTIDLLDYEHAITQIYLDCEPDDDAYHESIIDAIEDELKLREEIAEHRW